MSSHEDFLIDSMLAIASSGTRVDSCDEWHANVFKDHAMSLSADDRKIIYDELHSLTPTTPDKGWTKEELDFTKEFYK